MVLQDSGCRRYRARSGSNYDDHGVHECKVRMLCFAESQTFLIRDTIDKKVTSSELSNHQKSLVIRCSLFIDPQTLS